MLTPTTAVTDAILLLFLIFFVILEKPVGDVCSPSPCGPNSQCRNFNGQPVCSCLPGFIGSAPACRPQCVVNSDCAQNKACSNQKCIDPCKGTCGLTAKCQVVNHSPICSCPPSYTGDPFVQCQPTPRKKYIYINNFK